MSRNNNQRVAAVTAAAKEQEESGEVILSTGYRAKIKPVASSLIADVTSRIQDPPVPMWHNEDKGRDEPNPNDPAYLRALEAAERERGLAAMDAMILFGVQLLDPIPEDDEWMVKLKFLEKRGSLDLQDYDLSDPFEKRFVFLRYVAVANDDLSLIGKKSGVRPEDVEKAGRSFQGD